MQNVFETDLAWELIEVARPHLSACERRSVFVVTGAGDTFAAIHLLLNLAAARRIPLHSELVRRCHRWLDAYSAAGAHRDLRALIEYCSTHSGRGVPAAVSIPKVLTKTPISTELTRVEHFIDSPVAAG